MLEVASEKLTERERECLKHFRQAQERGGSFAEYCRTAGLKANEWHAVRHGMVHKGLLPGRRSPGAKRKPTEPRRSRFIPVRLRPSGSADESVPLACRVRHPSGWVIECASVPEVQWLTGLITGARS
jgi:hypothetical protein